MKYKRPSQLSVYVVILTFIILAVTACSSSSPSTPQDTATTVKDTPTAEITVTGQDVPQSPESIASAARILEPYPYTTPIPPPTPTILDGIYTKEVKFEGTPTPCRRCAPYRAEGGTWTLILDAGAFRVSHNTTNFQGIGSFIVSGDQIALFNDPNCHSYVGHYNWELDGQSLILKAVKDECAFGLRLKNLATGIWIRQTNEEGQKIDRCQPPSMEAAISGHWSIPDDCQLSINSNICTSVSEIPITECSALVSFYNSTDGPHWTFKQGWLETSQPCNWSGVTCSDGHVMVIALNYNELRGNLPPSIGDLPNLQTLSLHFNHLDGNIPPELGHLSNLQTLILHNNKLNGNIPPELGNLSSLKKLDLESNNLEGNIPAELGNLTNLETLNLNNNNLSGNIPPDLGNLANLRGLFLAGNDLSGTIPDELGNLSNLWMLNVNFNKLNGKLPPNLENLPGSGYDYFDWDKNQSSNQQTP